MGSTVKCGHDPGKVVTSPSPKLKVSGQPVLVKLGILLKPVGGCSTALTASTKPCSSVLSVITGEALKLKVGGMPVMLDTISGTTDGLPPGTVPATAGQTKLKAT